MSFLDIVQKVQDVEKLIKKIRIGKTAGEERIPPKLVKVVGRILFKPFADVINAVIPINTF